MTTMNKQKDTSELIKSFKGWSPSEIKSYNKVIKSYNKVMKSENSVKRNSWIFLGVDDKAKPTIGVPMIPSSRNININPPDHNFNLKED
jgi:hypothetical protein